MLTRKVSTRDAFNALCNRVDEARELAKLMLPTDSDARQANDRERVIHMLDEMAALLRIVSVLLFEDQRYRLTPPMSDLES
ncbi:hypothetical protein [Roseateles sp.]|uniref:hypothetical protein n=1 Tax=Roseateles sp. TaxID=1971397 RepID=UPI0031DAC79E